MNSSMTRLIKGIAGVIIVAVLLVVITNYWRDYRQAASQQPGSTTSGTVDATKSAPSAGSPKKKAAVVVVLIDGLNFRRQPETGAATIRGLKKGDRLTLVAAKTDWYQVKDSKGAVGWVAAKPQYVRLEK